MSPLIDLEIKKIKYRVHDNHSWHYANERQSRDRFLHLNEGDLFIDIGAYVGSWSIPAAMLGAQVIAFEPSNEVLIELQRNIELNNLKESIAVFPYLLSDWYHENIAYNNWEIKPQDVGVWETHILDDLICPSDIDNISLIKIDVEGHELQVLRGAYNVLKCSVPNVLVEVHTHLNVNKDDVIKFFGHVDKDYKHEVIPQDGGQYHHVYFSKEEK